MTFDIHQKIFDADGQPLEKVASKYQHDLIELFEQSPEAQALSDEGIEGGWVTMVLDLGQNYLGITPPQMSAADLREILLDLIPRKISAPADEAPEIIRELQAFWQFLQREFHLENAAACLSLLNDKQAVQHLKREMSNPDNFGIAKSIVMMGMEQGFDMQTQEGLDEWIKTYNAALTSGMGTPFTPPSGRPRMSREELESRIQIVAPDESLQDPTSPIPTPEASSPSHQDKKPLPSTADSYTPPLDKLLTYTDIEAEEPFPEISYAEQFGIGPEHIPELIRMATDDYLSSDDCNEFEATAPFHAIRALTELHAEVAIEPLLAFSDKASREDQDWILETLVAFHISMGAASLPALEQFLANPFHDQYAQNYAAEIIGKMPQKHPELRTECIVAVTRRLADFERNQPMLNESLIKALLRMKAVEAAPLIQEAFESGRVDDFWGVDWDEVQYELGLKERPAPEERPSLFSSLSAPARSTSIASHTPTHQSTKKTSASKKAKSKAKMAKASKKANRRKK